MKLIIDIDKELKSAIYRCGLFLNPTEKVSLIDAINNGTPLEEELHREKEQAYYLGYKDGRKLEWTGVAESEG